MAENSTPDLMVPPGMKPGEVPAGLDVPRRLWIVLPEKPTGSQQISFTEVRRRATEEGLSPVIVSATTTTGIGGTKFALLRPKDVLGLYRCAHRARTAVIALSGVKILLDISELPTNRGCVTLKSFIEHKCAYSLVSRPEEAEKAMVATLRWMSDIHCEGKRDPRCLPRAVFAADTEYDLETHEGRRRFLSRHRSADRPHALTDGDKKTWETGPCHTMDALQVAGCVLPLGFHWDVRTGRKTVIVTGWDRWSLRGGGYTNIHPDAFIRGGNATKSHPSKDDEPPQARIPRQLRRQGKRKKNAP